MEEVRQDVKRLKKHLHTWKRQYKRTPVQSAVHRILFVVYNVPEINEIRSNFAEYRNRLHLMLQILSVTGHNEILKGLEDIKASFREFGKRRESRLSLEETRQREREDRYWEWERLGFGEQKSPGEDTTLQAFLEQEQKKLEQSTPGDDAAQEHLDRITSKLWDAQPSAPIPQFKSSTTHSGSGTGTLNAESFNNRDRRGQYLSTPKESPLGSSSRNQRTLTPRDSVLQTHPSTSSRSRHSQRKSSISSRGSASTTTSHRKNLLDKINPWFQPTSSNSSRRPSRPTSNLQSSVGTPRPPPDQDIIPEISNLSLGGSQNTEGWETVPTRAPIRSNAATTSSRSSGTRARRPTSRTRFSQRTINVLCVDFDNTGMPPFIEMT